MTQRTIDINVPVLARVEGEGALELKIHDQHIDALRLRIYEPPRFFEKFLEGRDYYDVPDAVARICGICPVAYQMSAVNAIESIFHIATSTWTQAMRRAMYCGEWLQSHSLHIHMLAAPDFLGANSIIDLAKTHPAEVQRGLKLQGLGNDLISLFGARPVHPVGVRTGGFHRAPPADAVQDMLARLRAAISEAEALVSWTASLDLPDDEQDFVSVALRHPRDYPITAGRIVSDRGLDIGIDEYEDHFSESQVPHSTALHSLLHDRPYLLGPLARINLNRDRLPEAVSSVMDATGIHFPSRNMFHSIVARAVEIHYAVVEAIRLLEDYSEPTDTAVDSGPVAGTGFGCTEAPRGLLWHRYRLDGDGRVLQARIVPPTSQNQARIEEDLRRSLERFGLQRDETELRLHAEKVIRNYDPCISCATHFLRLDVERLAETSPNVQQRPLPDRRSKPDSTIRVIGIGSPFGADRLGPDVVQVLAQDPELQRYAELEFHTLDRPASGLQALLQGCGQVILIDALATASVNPSLRGRVVEPDARDLAPDRTGLSSHAAGVAEVLALHQALQDENDALPRPTIHIFALDTGGDTEMPFDRESVVALGHLVKKRLVEILGH